jgi:site-specific DNA-methyltransferase (adenine-specific)
VKPYYDHGGITIYHGDCREILPTLALGADAMVFTDPPYGVDYDGGTVLRPKLVGDATFGCYEWLIPALPSVAYVCCPDKALPVVVALAGKRLRSVIVWRKQAQYGALSAHYKQANEFIAYIVPSGAASLWCGPTNETTDWEYDRNARSLHPTEKPTALAGRAIRNHSAGLVLDPYCGSGSTLDAARNLGRRAIGIEIEERYCEIAAKRLSQEVLGL